MKNAGVQERYPKPKRSSAPLFLAGLVLVALVVLGGFLLSKRSKAREQQMFVDAEVLYQSEQYEAAATALNDFLSRYDQSPRAPQASYYLASTQQALGEHEAATPLWEKLLQDTTFPQGQLQSIAYNLGLCLERTGDLQGSVSAYQKATQGPDAQLAAVSWLRIGEYHEAQKDLAQSAQAYRNAADQFPQTVEGKQAAARLSELTLPRALRVDAETYIVQRGDVLATIARKTGSSVGQIMLANGLTGPNLSIGDRLLIPKLSLSLDVGLDERRALLKLGEQIVKTYPTCIGSPDTPTPEGMFRIINKLDKPDWRNPDGILIPYGDPENELGVRWLGIESDEIRASRGFGLHGTIDPNSIGQSVSHGCLRFYNEDIEELFGLLKVGTPVRIGSHTQPAQWYQW